MNPLLMLECQRDLSRLLYHRDVSGHASAAEVRVIDLSLRVQEWERWQEQAAIILTGAVVALPRYTWQEWCQALPVSLEPESVAFDPGTSFVHQTNALKLHRHTVLAQSEHAMAHCTTDFLVLALCCPEGWVRPHFSGGQVGPSQHSVWRIWLTGWESGWSCHQWSCPSEISFPSDASLAPWEYPAWPEAGVALTPGRRRYREPRWLLS